MVACSINRHLFMNEKLCVYRTSHGNLVNICRLMRCGSRLPTKGLKFTLSWRFLIFRNFNMWHICLVFSSINKKIKTLNPVQTNDTPMYCFYCNERMEGPIDVIFNAFFCCQGSYQLMSHLKLCGEVWKPTKFSDATFVFHLPDSCIDTEAITCHDFILWCAVMRGFWSNFHWHIQE